MLTDLFGPERIQALTYYRPGITNETALRNMKRTAQILGTELVIHTDHEAYRRFRKNLEIILCKPGPEAVRVLLCAGCRYGITAALYDDQGNNGGCQIPVGPDLKLFDFDRYFENDPDRIEEILRSRFDWQATDRSWHFD